MTAIRIPIEGELGEREQLGNVPSPTPDWMLECQGSALDKVAHAAKLLTRARWYLGHFDDVIALTEGEASAVFTKVGMLRGTLWQLLRDNGVDPHGRVVGRPRAEVDKEVGGGE